MAEFFESLGDGAVDDSIFPLEEIFHLD
jgi:hypothetical protein